MARCETCGTELQDASQRLCGGDRCRAVFMRHPTQGGPGSALDRREARRIVGPLLVLILLVLLATRTAHGEVPTPADFAACNEQAPHAVKAGTASPTGADHARADSARGRAMTTSAPDFTDPVVESSDPQIHGMEAEGAKNATYQAAYRGCMRRKGF